MNQEKGEQPISAAVLNHSTNEAGDLVFGFEGDWRLRDERPGADDAGRLISTDSPPAGVAFDSASLGTWDSSLVTVVLAIIASADKASTKYDLSGLPTGVQRLVALTQAVPEREGARKVQHETRFFAAVGGRTISVGNRARELATFLGELIFSFGRYVRGTATWLRSDLWVHVQEAGVEALPIVSLISFLIGMIFAFVGAYQLQQFGAGIFTADLVAIAMVREMAAIMTAIIMAGRTGAAYAAQIGTMKVNEEIDALSTLGINPVDFLVTPRVMALILMMPLLTMYSSLMGIIGGMMVGVVMLDVTVVQYTEQTINAVGFNSLFGGLFKSIVYGSMVALAGCQQGLACGNSAMAVGQSTTRAVVMGIVLIVVCAAILTVVYVNLGI